MTVIKEVYYRMKNPGVDHLLKNGDFSFLSAYSTLSTLTHKALIANLEKTRRADIKDFIVPESVTDSVLYSYGPIKQTGPRRFENDKYLFFIRNAV